MKVPHVRNATRLRLVHPSAARREGPRLLSQRGAKRFASRASPPGSLFEMLEPYEGKLSRMVLRGGRSGNAPLPLGAAHLPHASVVFRK
jgi:hypothetical protein